MVHSSMFVACFNIRRHCEGFLCCKVVVSRCGQTRARKPDTITQVRHLSIPERIITSIRGRDFSQVRISKLLDGLDEWL
jgi:hypothetical protein